MAETKRIIEFVFRFRTNGYQDELDNMMTVAQDMQDLSGYAEREDGGHFYMEYIPTGSHWRDVTPGTWPYDPHLVSGTVVEADVRTEPFHPAAADLPGGNKLSPPQEG